MTKRSLNIGGQKVPYRGKRSLNIGGQKVPYRGRSRGAKPPPHTPRKIIFCMSD